MSFVDGFYSFNLEISNSTAGIYASTRIRATKHPYESFEHLWARVLALAHSYEPELTFSEGLYQTEQPTIWKKDVTGEVLKWIEVGVPDKKKIDRALKHDRQSEFRIYFYATDQITTFTNLLRGSKSNWISPIHFFQFDPVVLAALAEIIKNNGKLSVTVLDDALYLDYEGIQFETLLPELQMWEEYQRTLSTAS